MKILKVRFANLNSLYGEWEIDLTAPAIVQSGLFAICGPTGAGKTTILDAISLALYGRTARIGDLSKSSNEVMSRRARTCFSEVTFETKGARYRCRWSQGRTLKRGGAGEGLSQIERCLAEDATGTLLAEKNRETGALVQSLTGLSFDQFCSTILLAQGRFAAFLNARADERSAILEQMTHTERFGELSMAVHERHRDEERASEFLKAQLSGVTPLSAEEVAHHEAAVRELTAQAEALAQDQEAARNHLQWLATIDRLSQEVAACQQALALQREVSMRFEPERQRLAAAERARQLRPWRQKLEALREAQRSEQARRAQALDERQRWAQAVTAAAEQATRAQSTLDQARAERDRLMPDIESAIELDERIEQKRRAVHEAQENLEARRMRAEQARQVLASTRAALDERLSALDSARAYLKGHAADEGLLAQLDGLCQRFDHLRSCEEARSDQQARLVTAQQVLDRAMRELCQTQGQRERAQSALDGGQERAARLSQARDGLLNHQPFSQWIEQRALLQRELKTVHQALRDLDERSALARRLADLRAAHELLEAEAPRRQADLAQARAHQQAMEAESAALAEALHRTQRCQSYAAARLALVEGEPCPLCGATAHPWTTPDRQAPGTLAAEEAALAQAIASQKRDRLMPAQQSVEALIAANADAEARHREMGELCAELCRRVDALDDAWRAAAQQIMSGSTWAEADGAARLLARRDDIEAALARLDLVLARVPEIERQIQEQSQRVEELAGALKCAEARVHQAELAQAQAQAQHGEGRALVQRARDDFRKAFEELSQALKPYEVALPLNVEARAQVRRSLSERRDRWQAQLERALSDERHLALLRQQRDAQQERCAELAQESAELESALEAQHSALDRERERRRALLQGRPHAEVSRALSQALKSAEASCDRARCALETARLNFEHQGRVLDELAARIGERAEENASAARDLECQLSTQGFASEADCRSAELDDERFGELKRRAEALAAKQGEAEVRLSAKMRELDLEQAKALTEERAAALEVRCRELHASISQVQQEIGQRQGLLAEDAAVRRRNATLVERIERQQAQVRRWARLDALIGSHDGKSFRNFAQGLTLDRLIALANEPLQTLTGRYVLCRERQGSACEPTLALAVIDRDQGDALRSVSNLSGGESFLVSLALALGLSRMAGEHVRIDSLFLDEGFGTLDENALAMVLGALCRLRHEGKVIGIISHVPQLREIEPRIEVQRLRRGQSQLSGPGCRALTPFAPAPAAHSRRKSAKVAQATGARPAEKPVPDEKVRNTA